ncbi:MAG TPA: very short patch repair endonuclease [Smithella sp.]|jgi:DNA mismatch endonuclease (patch repair protein)|nr:very short patch repair endonuclease [Smithella sp.]
MVDTLTRKERSEQMSLVRAKDTKLELQVRRLIYSLGYRYRLHVKDLPGKPDIVLRSRRKVIFIHGCFWHRHKNCTLARMPKSRLFFWKPKLEGNKARDKKNQKKLNAMGWSYLVIWECQLNKLTTLRTKIIKFLDEGKN